jgi:dynein light chain 1
MSNNQLKSWAELDKLANLDHLRDVLFAGNPMYADMTPEEARIEILRHIPQVQKIDGEMVKPSDREAASAEAQPEAA